MKRSGIGGKRELNAELNLTPFIDLLSTCVCFLLLSAVWIEVGSIEIKQAHGTAAAKEEKESFDLEVFFTSLNEANLYLKKGGKMVKTFKVTEASGFENLLGRMDETLSGQVLKDRETSREIGTATVSTAPGVNYGHLIGALDVLRKNKIVNIGVMSARNP